MPSTQEMLMEDSSLLTTEPKAVQATVFQEMERDCSKLMATTLLLVEDDLRVVP